MKGLLLLSMVCNVVLLWWCWRSDDRISKLEAIIVYMGDRIDEATEMVSTLCKSPLKIHEENNNVLRFDAYKNGEVQNEQN